MRKLIFIVLGAIYADAGFSEEWKTVVESNGLRKASVSGKAMTPDGLTLATLTLQCHPGNDGAVSIIHTVSAADKIKQFPWTAFEGPDAAATGKNLGKIQVFSKTGIVTLLKPLTGYFANPQAFAFSFSVPITQKIELKPFVDKLIRGAGTVSFCVDADVGSTNKICSEFIAKDASAAVKQTMASCYSD